MGVVHDQQESQYSSIFFRQYLKVPEEISDRVKTEHADEYEGVRHCIGLVIANLLASGRWPTLATRISTPIAAPSILLIPIF